MLCRDMRISSNDAFLPWRGVDGRSCDSGCDQGKSSHNAPPTRQEGQVSLPRRVRHSRREVASSHLQGAKAGMIDADAPWILRRGVPGLEVMATLCWEPIVFACRLFPFAT